MRTTLSLHYSKIIQVPSTLTLNHLLFLNLSNMNLQILPHLPQSLQKLIAINNRIIIIPQALYNLHYLDLSNNYIQFIPEYLTYSKSLQILKIKNNKIQTLVFNQNLLDLQIHKNPIKKINLKINQMKMLSFSCDWISYIHKQLNYWLTGQQIDGFFKGIKQQKKDWYDLVSFVQEFRENDNENVDDLLQLIIQRNEIQLLKYLYRCKSMQVIKCMINNKIVEQYCFRNLEWDMGMVNKNQLYYLHLAARYSNGKLFKLLIDEGYSMDIVDSDNNTVLDQLLCNFRQQDSGYILNIIINHYNNKDQYMKSFFRACAHNINAVTSLLTYIHKHKQLLTYFPIHHYYINSQSLLHYFTRQSDIHAIIPLLDLCICDPFIHNSQRLTPKQQYNITYLTKKYLTKYQKLYLYKQLVKHIQQQQTQPQSTYLHCTQPQNSQKTSIIINNIQTLIKQLKNTIFISKQIQLIQQYYQRFINYQHIQSNLYRIIHSLPNQNILHMYVTSLIKYKIGYSNQNYISYQIFQSYPIQSKQINQPAITSAIFPQTNYQSQTQQQYPILKSNIFI